MAEGHSTRAFLLEQCARYPAAGLPDFFKALYQSSFGCEHLVADAAAADAIRAEAAADTVRRREIEPLDGSWCRIYLGMLDTGLAPQTLAKVFARSAALPHEAADGLERRLSVLLALAREGRLPMDASQAAAEIAAWRDAGFPACRHSEAYRAAYHPAYRVAHWRYARLVPLLAAIDRVLAEKPRVCLAIEGGSAGGKSTLAEELAALYDAQVLHADDFFLRPEQRTPERYAQPGGNLDRERLAAEVLEPLHRGQTVAYRAFDCQSMTLRPPVQREPRRLNILEGAYSMHPELASFSDLSVFLEISPQTQRRRILHRNGAEWGERFFERWIPLENTYFQATDARRRCTLTLEEDLDEAGSD